MTMAHKTFFKHDEPSRVDLKRERQATAEQLQRDVYRAVDERDQYRCRVCRERCDPRALDMLRKAHRHHIEYRSAGGGTCTRNVVTLCAICHDLEHRHVMSIRGDADIGIEVWRFSDRVGWYLLVREAGVCVVEHD
jgi:hypothetical protein